MAKTVHLDKTKEDIGFKTWLRERNENDVPLFFRNDEPQKSTFIFEEIIRSAKSCVRIVTNRLDGQVFAQGDLWKEILEKLERSGSDFRIMMIVRYKDVNRDHPHLWEYFEAAKKKHGEKLQWKVGDAELVQDTTIADEEDRTIGYYDFVVGDQDMYRIEDYLNSQEAKMLRSFNGFNEPPGDGTATELAELFDRHFFKK